MRTRSTVVASLVALVGVAPAARSQGIGGGGPGETQFSLLPLYQIPEDPLLLGVTIGTTLSPIPIELDPAGPAWSKQFVAPGIFSPRGSRVYIWESVLITGTEFWSGWRARVESSELQWMLVDNVMSIEGTTMLQVNGAAPPGLSVAVSGEWLFFSFDPLAPGTTVEMLFDLAHTGPDPVPPFSMRQFPVPEPAALPFIVVAGVAIVGRHRVRTV